MYFHRVYKKNDPPIWALLRGLAGSTGCKYRTFLLNCKIYSEIILLLLSGHRKSLFFPLWPCDKNRNFQGNKTLKCQVTGKPWRHAAKSRACPTGYSATRCACPVCPLSRSGQGSFCPGGLDNRTFGGELAVTCRQANGGNVLDTAGGEGFEQAGCHHVVNCSCSHCFEWNGTQTWMFFCQTIKKYSRKVYPI